MSESLPKLHSVAEAADHLGVVPELSCDCEAYVCLSSFLSIALYLALPNGVPPSARRS